MKEASPPLLTLFLILLVTLSTSSATRRTQEEEEWRRMKTAAVQDGPDENSWVGLKAASSRAMRRPFSGKCRRGHISTKRIVGGMNALPGEFPWQALLYIGEGPQPVICSGTLILAKWVLTAAHCFPSGLDKTLVVLGEYDRRVQEKGSLEVNASGLISHPDFDPFTLDNDVALLQLQQPVGFTDRIGLICLALPKEVPSSGIAVISGWGTTLESHEESNIMQKVGLKIISNAECIFYYDGFYNISSNMLCTYTVGKDACQGDSGGPLVTKMPDGYWVLIGMASYGYGCGLKNNPGVYVKVSNYINWIKRHTNKGRSK